MSPDLPPKKRTVRKHVRRLASRPGQAGPRSKLTDDVQQKICNAVSSGQTFDCAASLVRIDRHTLADWRARGQQEPDSRYGEFNRALEAALLASETMMVHKILSDPDWKAAKWILKNRFPDRYRERYELSGPAGSPIPVEHSGQFTVNVTCTQDDPDPTIYDESGEPIPDGENPSKIREAAASNGQ
jgi:succinate dehydrogenase flavin-adding protein (antitoxin of CptAB toxin-antitoxin module)